MRALGFFDEFTEQVNNAIGSMTCKTFDFKDIKRVMKIDHELLPHDQFRSKLIFLGRALDALESKGTIKRLASTKGIRHKLYEITL